MMAYSSLVLATLLVARDVALASAATAYIVGESKGWTTGVNYTSWASKNKFIHGDKLVFSYVTMAHTVTEVVESGYDDCSGEKALSSDDSGSTTISLDTPGAHYFICTVADHCAKGMKLSVTVAGPSRGSLLQVPVMGSIVVAAAGALINLALH